MSSGQERSCDNCGGHYGYPCEGACAPDPDEKVGICLTCGHSCARMHRAAAERLPSPADDVKGTSAQPDQNSKEM